MALRRKNPMVDRRSVSGAGKRARAATSRLARCCLTDAGHSRMLPVVTPRRTINSNAGLPPVLPLPRDATAASFGTGRTVARQASPRCKRPSLGWRPAIDGGIVGHLRQPWCVSHHRCVRQPLFTVRMRRHVQARGGPEAALLAPVSIQASKAIGTPITRAVPGYPGFRARRGPQPTWRAHPFTALVRVAGRQRHCAGPVA